MQPSWGFYCQSVSHLNFFYLPLNLPQAEEPHILHCSSVSPQNLERPFEEMCLKVLKAQPLYHLLQQHSLQPAMLQKICHILTMQFCLPSTIFSVHVHGSYKQKLMKLKATYLTVNRVSKTQLQMSGNSNKSSGS